MARRSAKRKSEVEKALEGYSETNPIKMILLPVWLFLILFVFIRFTWIRESILAVIHFINVCIKGFFRGVNHLIDLVAFTF
jgi:hypothetical protein